MKKLFLVLCLLIFVTNFFSCKKSDKSSENMKSNNSLNKNKTVLLANPIVQSTATEIAQQFGVSFIVPQDATDIFYFIVADKIAQVDFKWQGFDCHARVKQAQNGNQEDISGFYYKWQNEKSIEFAHCDGTAKWNSGKTENRDENCGVCVWQDSFSKTNYSVSMIAFYEEKSQARIHEAVSYEKLIALATSVFAIE